MCIIRNAQTFLHMETPPLWVGNVLFEDGNRSFVGGGYALYVWKRRCADVRAGTQAPPLPFLMWFRVIKLPENSLPHHKHKCIVVTNSLPRYKHECIVVANSLPRHKYE